MMADEPAMLMPYQGAWVTVTVRDMLRERDARLAALEHENAAMREIVAAVADVPPYNITDNTDCYFHGECFPEWVSQGDGGYWQHHPDCVSTRARAVLATQTPVTGATGTSAAGEATCELCNGTGVYVHEIAWENPDGTIGAETKRITCHGCNGTGKRNTRTQTAGGEGEA